MRLGTANTYDNTLANLTNRQADLADLQEKLSAGKKVIRASDDPTGAAQAERAMTRSARVTVEQRALNIQRTAMTEAESTLGASQDALQRFRELVISAGNAAYGGTNRTIISQELRGLRDQIFNYASRLDSNNIPLFGGLGGSGAPFTDFTTGVVFNGVPGQRAASTVGIPSTMDGQAVWMNVASGNGVFNVDQGAGNTGGVWADPGEVTDPSVLTGNNYTVTFNVTATTPPVTTFDVSMTTLTPPPTTTPVLVGQPYADGKTISFDGMSFTAHGAPANGDTLAISASTRLDLFGVLDAAITSIDGQENGPVLSHELARTLMQLETGMDRISSARGQAGELLKRADIIDNNQEDRLVSLAADRSRAEDIDMVQGISDFQTQQTGYQAALQTYAQVQRLSLFNYVG